MPLMFLLIFIIFVAVSLYSESYVRQAIAQYSPRRYGLKTYTIITAAFWIACIAVIITVMALGASHPLFMQTAGIVIFIFLLNGISKALLAIAILVGRITKLGRLFNTIGIALIIILNCAIIISALSNTSTLRIEKTVIESPKITDSLNGFRIVVVSDMHTGLLLNRYAMVEKIVAEINSLNPDIVINCGDIVNHDYTELDDRVMDILSGIKSRYGVFSILGNHDLGIYIRDTARISESENIAGLSRKQHALGWHLLRNESETVAAGGDSITITGLDYPEELIHRSHRSISGTQELSAAYAGINPEKFNITISHAPQTWDNILSDGSSDLTLSGHVHSLQSKIKLGKGRGWSPATFFYDRWSGLYHEQEKYLYINDGIGYAMIPVRLGVKPEITLLVLKK